MIKLKIEPITMVKIRNIANDKSGIYSNSAILKAKIIKMRYENKNIKEIVNETHLSERTIRNYLHNYQNQTFNAFFNCKRKVRKSSLDNNVEIKQYFKENQPKTYKDAVETLEEVFNVHKSLSAVRIYLKSQNINTEVKSKKSSLYNNQKIKHYFELNRPKTYKDAVESLERIFNIHKSLSAVRIYLKSQNIHTNKRKKSFNKAKKKR